MAARDADSMTPAQGEFVPHKPRAEPLTTHGHKPGVKASPADYAEEFTAKTLPPGSAPPDQTFKPNPIAEIPGQANNGVPLSVEDDVPTYASPTNTLPGPTSADVDRGVGHPMERETSTEIRHDGMHKRNKEREGLAGLAPGGSGLRDEGNAEARRVARESTEHGPIPARKPNATLPGAEDKMPASEVIG